MSKTITNIKDKTLWETKNRSFSKDLEFGKIGEQRVIEHLKNYKSVIDVIDISNSKKGIKDDIDIEIVYADGHISTGEIKTDTMAHRTGNLAYEEYSHNNPGCFARTKADHILYLVENTGEVYVLNPDKFRSFISLMKNNTKLATSLGVRPIKMGQGASGYLVPIKSIINRDVCECRFKVA